MSWFLLLNSLLMAEPLQLDRPVPQLRHGPELRETLQAPLSATWDNVPVRVLLRRLSETAAVGIVLDRRLDPTTPLQLTLVNQPLDEGLHIIAQRLKAGYTIAGNTVMIGPDESIRWLRTTIAQREAELTASGTKIPERRQFALLDRRTEHWQDLQTPREILEQIGTRYQLNIEGLSDIPHDLWASATLSSATAAEALSIVLSQLNRDFRWSTDGKAITIVPYQQPALIEKHYQPKKAQSPAAALAAMKKDWPDLEGRVDGKTVLVLGRVEDHERLTATDSASTSSSRPRDPVPLHRRRFTLRTENVPVRAILRELEKTGVVLEYDEQAFKKVGVNLETPVSVDVKQVEAKEFLEKVFQPLAISFEIDNQTIRMKYAPPPE